jgi:hypothetical protein
VLFEFFVANAIRDMEGAVSRAAESWSGQRYLLQRCRPIQLHMSNEDDWLLKQDVGLFTAEHTYTPALRRSDLVVLHQSHTDPITTLADLKSTILAMRRIEPSALEVRFVGFPKSLLDAFEGWHALTTKPFGGMSQPWSQMFDRDQAWSWERPDGTLFTMHSRVGTLTILHSNRIGARTILTSTVRLCVCQSGEPSAA